MTNTHRDRRNPKCAPHGQHCDRCRGVHGETPDGYRTFVTSLTWDTTEGDDMDIDECLG
jgi:hypothetical protein